MWKHFCGRAHSRLISMVRVDYQLKMKKTNFSFLFCLTSLAYFAFKLKNNKKKLFGTL